MAIKFRQEITDWGDRQIANHIYITNGRQLIGYVPEGSKTPIYFKAPKNLWSATGRKFKDLTKKQTEQYL